MALTVVTCRFTREGFNPNTGKPIVKRQLIKFAEFSPGDVINVSKDQGTSSDVLNYIAAKLNLSADSLEVSEWGSNWQIRHRIGEVI